MYKNKLPYIITNENTVIITEQNHDGYSCHHDDIGKYLYEYPFTFQQGKTFPKKIIVDNLAMFDENGKEMLGYSVHAGFNTEVDQIDQCIGFITYLYKSVCWKLTRNNKYALIWFKNLDGSDQRVHPTRFVINGYFEF